MFGLGHHEVQWISAIGVAASSQSWCSGMTVILIFQGFQSWLRSHNFPSVCVCFGRESLEILKGITSGTIPWGTNLIVWRPENSVCMLKQQSCLFVYCRYYLNILYWFLYFFRWIYRKIVEERYKENNKQMQETRFQNFELLSVDIPHVSTPISCFHGMFPCFGSLRFIRLNAEEKDRKENTQTNSAHFQGGFYK